MSKIESSFFFIAITFLHSGLTKIKESQEGMIKRVINEALEKSRAEELKGDAEGFKKEMTSVRNSINQFRESKTEITESHAAELYNQAFVVGFSLQFFHTYLFKKKGKGRLGQFGKNFKLQIKTHPLIYLFLRIF